MMITDRIEELTNDTLATLRLAVPDHAWPEAPVHLAIGNVLRAFHDEANHCDACESAKYRQGKADALAEVISDLRTRAGNLFADRQDKEAEYLRDMITPLRHMWNAEIAQVEYLNVKSHHTCTLDGTQRWLA
jgi:hypothetical protein